MTEEYQVMYRRYRPQAFKEILGQGHITEPLRESVMENRVGKVHLFLGERGTGKTTTARVLAKALNCENLEEGEPCNNCAACFSVTEDSGGGFHEFDAGSNGKIDSIRNIIELTTIRSVVSANRVILIDEVQQLSSAGADALLKTLEETPEGVYFILCTTDPGRIKRTIQSRSIKWNFKLLGEDVLADHVKELALREKNLELTEQQIQAIVEEGNGSARDTISTLERVIAGGSLQTRDYAVDIIDALIDRSIPDLFMTIAEAEQEGVLPSKLATTLSAYVRNATLAIHNPDFVTVHGRKREILLEHADELRVGRLNLLSTVLAKATSEMANSIDSRFVLEHNLVSFISPEATDRRMDDVLQQMEDMQEKFDKALHVIEQLSESPERAENIVSDVLTSSTDTDAQRSAQSVWQDDASSTSKSDDAWPAESKTDDVEEAAESETVEEPVEERQEESVSWLESDIDPIIDEITEILEENRKTEAIANTFSNRCSGGFIDPDDPTIMVLQYEGNPSEKVEGAIFAATKKLALKSGQSVELETD